jgi:hypothetical protein
MTGQDQTWREYVGEVLISEEELQSRIATLGSQGGGDVSG